MSGPMKVDYATIHQAAQDCQKTGGELENLFEKLKSDIAPLTDSWSGDAKDAWHDRQVEWNQALEDMKGLLARIATALPQIADGYQATDTGVTRMFGG
ncbi:WXG100 family type VII secretion target [Amycolatopsis thermophila]|uniref:ESAT-6-like protein n=1 Tax=Amycolatopsis thermophila TaxID=206084 RepID=A0ABU0ER03_9PSEU|nr:WXG100 family type VII secretion target [Amycolatopsis thermophila]MDQ0377513.1 WXG100 family type VII secretion target [Amycolatopsis thermophila]